MSDLKNTNYVLVSDYEGEEYLSDCQLLGWNNKYDWFDNDTCGFEILTKTGRVKKNKYGLLLDIDRWVSVYVSDEISPLVSHCDSGNNEGYDCVICKLEKDGNDYKLIPVYPFSDEDDVEDDEDE